MTGGFQLTGITVPAQYRGKNVAVAIYPVDPNAATHPHPADATAWQTVSPAGTSGIQWPDMSTAVKIDATYDANGQLNASYQATAIVNGQPDTKNYYCNIYAQQGDTNAIGGCNATVTPVSGGFQLTGITVPTQYRGKSVAIAIYPVDPSAATHPHPVGATAWQIVTQG